MVDIRFFRFPLDITLRATPLVQIISRVCFAATPALCGLDSSQMALGAASPILIFGIVAPGWVKNTIPDCVL